MQPQKSNNNSQETEEDISTARCRSKSFTSLMLDDGNKSNFYEVKCGITIHFLGRDPLLLHCASTNQREDIRVRLLYYLIAFVFFIFYQIYYKNAHDKH